MKKTEKEPQDIKADQGKGEPIPTPPPLEEHLKRIESKIDRLLYLLGDGRGRTTEELRRMAEDTIARLRERQARKEERKKENERPGKKE